MEYIGLREVFGAASLVEEVLKLLLVDLRIVGPNRSGSWRSRFQDDTMEQWRCALFVVEKMVTDLYFDFSLQPCKHAIKRMRETYGMRTSRQAKQGDIARVASKFANIFLYPFK